jgi:hypothetical protein
VSFAAPPKFSILQQLNVRMLQDDVVGKENHGRVCTIRRSTAQFMGSSGLLQIRR